MANLKIVESYVLLTLNSKKSLNFHETLKIVCFYVGTIFDLEESKAISEEEGGLVKIINPLPASIKYLTPVYNYVKNNEKGIKRVVENFSFNFLWDAHQKIWGDLLAKLEKEKLVILTSSKDLEWDVDSLRINMIMFKLKLKLLKGTYYDEFSLIVVYIMKETNLLKDYFSKLEITKINSIINTLKMEEKLNSSQITILKFIKIIDATSTSLNKAKKIKVRKY